MSEETKTALDIELAPIAIEDRTLSGFSIFAIWFATNTVTTALLVGMQLVPGLNIGQAIGMYFFGAIIGFAPVMLVGFIGFKTGLPTMAMSRASFGINGSIIPSVLNVVILVAWSWAQAALGGNALNHISTVTIGFDNASVYTVLVEFICIAIALYAVKGISVYEKVAMGGTIIILVAVIAVLFKDFSIASVFGVPRDMELGMTFMIAFDSCVGLALSYAPMAADYNRSAKSRGSAFFGCWSGYVLGTTVIMSIGGLMVAMVLARTGEVVDEPTAAYTAIGLGVPGAVAIFLSIVAANVMCLYSSTMSIVNVLPRAKYSACVIILGLICAAGALFSGILDFYLNFVGMVGVLFLPMFSIMIADFFIVQKQKYNMDAIMNYKEDGEYYGESYYYKGFNILAISVYIVAAFVSGYLLLHPVTIGATIPAFLISFVLYSVIAAAMNGRKTEK